MLRTRQRNQRREGAYSPHVALVIVGIGGNETGIGIDKNCGIRSSRLLRGLTIHRMREHAARLHRHHKALRRTNLRKHRHRQPDQGHQHDQLTEAAQGLHERMISDGHSKFLGEPHHIGR